MKIIRPVRYLAILCVGVAGVLVGPAGAPAQAASNPSCTRHGSRSMTCVYRTTDSGHGGTATVTRTWKPWKKTEYGEEYHVAISGTVTDTNNSDKHGVVVISKDDTGNYYEGFTTSSKRKASFAGSRYGFAVQVYVCLYQGVFYKSHCSPAG